MKGFRLRRSGYGAKSPYLDMKVMKKRENNQADLFLRGENYSSTSLAAVAVAAKVGQTDPVRVRRSLTLP